MLTQGRVQSPLGTQSSRQTFARGPRASETSPTLTTFHIELPFGKTVVKDEIPVPFSFLRQQRERDLEKSGQSGGQSLEEGSGMSLRKAMCREEGESSNLEGPAKTGFRGPPGRRRRYHFLTQKCPLSSCRLPLAPACLCVSRVLLYLVLCVGPQGRETAQCCVFSCWGRALLAFNPPESHLGPLSPSSQTSGMTGWHLWPTDLFGPLSTVYPWRGDELSVITLVSYGLIYSALPVTASKTQPKEKVRCIENVHGLFNCPGLFLSLSSRAYISAGNGSSSHSANI